MSQYQRRVSLVVGAVFLLVFAASLWASLETATADPASLTTLAIAVGGGALLFGGIAFVIAGVRERATVAGRTLEWWQTQSIGFVFLGVYMAVSGLTQSSTTSVFGLATSAAGIGSAAFGLQRLRDGRPEETEPSVRQVATIIVGTMVGFLLLVVSMIWVA